MVQPAPADGARPLRRRELRSPRHRRVAPGRLRRRRVPRLREPASRGPDDDRSSSTCVHRYNAQFAAGCMQRMGAYAGQVGTRNVARDLEAIRIALGEPKLNYLGYSYGTVVGATYAQMFPATVRAHGARRAARLLAQRPRLRVPRRRTGFMKALDGVPRLVRADPLLAAASAGTPRDLLQPAHRARERGTRCPRRTRANGVTPRRRRSRRACSRTRCCRCSTTGPAAGRSSPTRLAPGGAGGLGRGVARSSPTSTSAGSPDGTWQPLVEANAVINCVDRPAKPKAPREAAELADVATLPGRSSRRGAAPGRRPAASGMPKPAKGDKLGDVTVTRHAADPGDRHHRRSGHALRRAQAHGGSHRRARSCSRSTAPSTPRTARGRQHVHRRRGRHVPRRRRDAARRAPTAPPD